MPCEHACMRQNITVTQSDFEMHSFVSVVLS